MSALGIFTLINKTLYEFVDSWNNHPLSTEHNQTPNQLFCLGILNAPSNQHTHPANNSLPLTTTNVNVPSEKFMACNALKTTLHALSNPLLLVHEAQAKTLLGVIYEMTVVTVNKYTM